MRLCELCLEFWALKFRAALTLTFRVHCQVCKMIQIKKCTNNLLYQIQ